MPVLFSWLVNVFTVLVSFLVKYFVFSTAKVLAITTLFVGLVIAFTLAIDSLALGVLTFLPLSGWTKFGSSLIPSNTDSCISAYSASLILRFFYLQRLRYIIFVSQSVGGVEKVR